MSEGRVCACERGGCAHVRGRVCACERGGCVHVRGCAHVRGEGVRM